VKTHPRQPPGGRATDRGSDLPAERAGYAIRDLTALIGTCAGHGPNIGIYAERLLDDPLPWTRMRSVYRLVGLVRRYGPGPIETACTRSLDLDVVSVSKIAATGEKALETQAPATSFASSWPAATVTYVFLRSGAGTSSRSWRTAFQVERIAAAGQEDRRPGPEPMRRCRGVGR